MLATLGMINRWFRKFDSAEMSSLLASGSLWSSLSAIPKVDDEDNIPSLFLLQSALPNSTTWMTPQGFIGRLQYSSWSSLGETPCKLWKHEGCGHSTSISAARRSARGQQPDIWLLLWDCLARFFDLYNSNELVKRFISAFDLSVRWCSYFEFKLAVRSSYYVEPGDKKHNEIREVELVHLDRQRSGSRQNADDCGSKL